MRFRVALARNRDSGILSTKMKMAVPSLSCQQLWDMLQLCGSEVHASLEDWVPAKLGTH